MPNLSGKHGNQLEDRIVVRAKEMEDYIVQALTADGPPYGTEELKGRELYDQLVAMRANGDPAYYGDPRAAQMLARLSELYGDPGPVAPPLSNPLQAQQQLGGLVQ